MNRPTAAATAAVVAAVAAGYTTNIPPTNDIYFMCVVSTNLYRSYSLYLYNNLVFLYSSRNRIPLQ